MKWKSKFIKVQNNIVLEKKWYFASLFHENVLFTTSYEFVGSLYVQEIYFSLGCFMVSNLDICFSRKWIEMNLRELMITKNKVI